jgi:hypothetical protein
VDTFAAARSSRPQDMPEMGDEWGKWLISTCSSNDMDCVLSIDLACHLQAIGPMEFGILSETHY